MTSESSAPPEVTEASAESEQIVERPSLGEAEPDHRKGEPGDTEEWRIAGTIRIAGHLAVWAAVLVPTISELTRGWRPFGDDAAIASRAYAVFSLHAPLTGLASAASFQTGHAFYDPGPLMFYLLAVPERLDVSQGLLWGAALCAGIALSVAVEAAWAAGRAVGVALVAFAVLDMAWLTPQVFENLAWNAYFPLPFFIASVAAAGAVAVGKTSWWPVLVVTASVAAQSHLFFVVPGLVLVLVALAFGILHSSGSRRFGWLCTGLALGVLCWLAPIVQQFADANGNLAALLHAGQGRTTLGAGFALQEVGLAASAHPVWLTRLPAGFLDLAALEKAHPPWYGGLVLGALVGVAVWAFLTGRRGLGALSVITLAVTASVAVGFAVFPAANVLSVGYLVDSLWPIGILLWAVAVWAVVALARIVLPRVGAAWDERLRRRPAAVVAIGSGCVLVGLAILAVIGLRPAVAHAAEVGWSTADVNIVSGAASAIERAVPPGPVSIVVLTPDFFTGTWATEGIAYRLETDGWQPGTSGDPAKYSGLTLPPGTIVPSFVIRLAGSQVIAVTMTS